MDGHSSLEPTPPREAGTPNHRNPQFPKFGRLFYFWVPFEVTFMLEPTFSHTTCQKLLKIKILIPHFCKERSWRPFPHELSHLGVRFWQALRRACASSGSEGFDEVQGFGLRVVSRALNIIPDRL